MKWFHNLKIGAKLMSGFILVALIAGLVGYFGVSSIRKIDEADKGLYEVNIKPLNTLQNISIVHQKIRFNLQEIIIDKNADELKKHQEKLKELDKNLENHLTVFEKSIRADDILQEFKHLKSAITKFDPIKEKVISLAVENRKEEATLLLRGEGLQLATSIDESINKIFDLKIDQAKKKSENSDIIASDAQQLSIVLTIGCMIIALLLGFFISRIISKPIMLLLDATEKLASGDINIKCASDTKDEIGLLLNAFMKITNAISPLVTDIRILSQAAIEGKLASRADASKHSGAFRDIMDGINNTLDAVITPLNVAANYVDRIGKGDIPPKITDSYNGDFNVIKNNLNNCINNINALIGDANMLAMAAVEGKLATRADATKHSGDYSKIVEGVNITLDSVIGPLNVAANYVDRISKGDIPAKITDSYNGDFNVIKSNLNN
ncbi:MAG: methyl-accepting chemotaxis protein, partial [Deltaproteobacteria bacterium]|nr:methyl-accepting chemotaxis protein [Deltaproteobacteria bacterium]